MTLVSARGRHRDGSRRAFLFAANRTAHAPRYIIKLGIPTAKSGQQVRCRVTLTKAGTTSQNEGVLPEFIAELRDF
jgi:hypothetical protein